VFLDLFFESLDFCLFFIFFKSLYRMSQNKIENFHCIVDDFPRRLDARIEAGGKHFE
jgi:hypothetical protein